MPAVQDRLVLYLVSARTALINEAFGQTDANLDEAIKLIPQLPNTLDVRAVIVVNTTEGLLCTLLRMRRTPSSTKRGSWPI